MIEKPINHKFCDKMLKYNILICVVPVGIPVLRKQSRIVGCLFLRTSPFLSKKPYKINPELKQLPRHHS